MVAATEAFSPTTVEGVAAEGGPTDSVFSPGGLESRAAEPGLAGVPVLKASLAPELRAMEASPGSGDWVTSGAPTRSILGVVAAW